MLRLLPLLALAVPLALSLGVYWLKHDTRKLDARVQALERRIERSQAETRALEAEHARLTAPERLDPLARHELNLEPVTPKQVMRASDLARHGLAPAPSVPKSQP